LLLDSDAVVQLMFTFFRSVLLQLKSTNSIGKTFAVDVLDANVNGLNNVTGAEVIIDPVGPVPVCV
jgi:hypothetical protein